MSAANNINNTDTKNNTDATSGTPPEKKRWKGRCVFSIAKGTWALGGALIITGIVLFILNSVLTYRLMIAAAVSTGVGGGVLLLGLVAHCCNKKLSALKNNANQLTDPENEAPPPANKIEEPLKAEIDTKAFFESKGVFGLPQGLINEINKWRQYRTNPQFDLPLDAGLILYGPPGTGKTTIAQYIAELLGGEYMERSSGDLNSKLFGESERNINALFTVPEGTFRVVTIDEISGFLPKRKGFDYSDTLVNHFLGKVNGIAKTKPNFILVGTTNNIEQLDPAVVRRGRLGKKFKIENPKKVTREKIFNYHLTKLPLTKGEDWTSFAKTLTEKTEGKSCADIWGIVTDAQSNMSLANRTELVKQDFLDAIDPPEEE